MQKNKQLGLIIIIGLLALIIIFSISNIDFIELMIKSNQIFYQKIGITGIYIATFFISILGTFTIMVPIPYLLGIITALLILPVNPIILAIFSAIGSTIGEISAWLFGKGTAQVISEKKYSKAIKGLTELVKKGYGQWVIFFYSLTPLPDDILLIALGIENYPIKKIILPGLMGKFLMICTLILVIFLAKNTQIGQSILYLYGLEITSDGIVQSTQDHLMSTITMITTIIITLLIIIIDWERVWNKITRKKTIKKQKPFK